MIHQKILDDFQNNKENVCFRAFSKKTAHIKNIETSNEKD
jgi:hypothetical protein